MDKIKQKAINHFSKYFNITQNEAKDCNAMTIDCMVSFAKTYHDLLLHSGKLAYAARLVTTANAKNISGRIESLEEVLDAYDNKIFERNDK